MNKSFLLLMLIYPTSYSFGQIHKTIDIIKKADSLIIAAVGKDVFEKHYKLDTTSKIDYSKESRIKNISLTSKTNKRFKFISVNYIFYVTKYTPPLVQTSVLLDKELNPKYAIDTSFIPKFIRQKTVNNFLTDEQALTIAKSTFKKQGLKIESKIYYDLELKDYVWEFINVIYESKGGYKIVEFIKIDPVNGQTILFFEGLLGRLF